MRRRKIVLVLLLVILCAALAAVFWPEKGIPEPVYKGEKLSAWLGKIAPGSIPPQVEEAVQAIGTNGIPCYLEWLQYKPGIGKRAQNQLAEYGRRWLGLKWVSDDPKFARANAAFGALTMLGERAEPAIPLFIQFATNVAALSAKQFGMNQPFIGYLGLTQIGRPAVPAFLSLMKNPDPRVRATAVGLSEQNGDASLLAQVQIALHDSDHWVRLAATNVMKRFDSSFTPAETR
jgi:hypothetical protein